MTGLDPISERDGLHAIEALAVGRTTLVVAHHMSTVLHADRIVFLRHGRIEEQGTHQGLLARGGPYAEFFFIQWSRLGAGVSEDQGGTRESIAERAGGHGDA